MLATCPRCQYEYEIDLAGVIPLSERQHDALEAVRRISRRDVRRTATTRAVATSIGYSERWCLEWLHQLELLDLIHRPKGKKSGWAIRQYCPTIVQLRIMEPIREIAA